MRDYGNNTINLWQCSHADVGNRQKTTNPIASTIGNFKIGAIDWTIA